MKDFAIELTDRPGELGRVATALSRYGVNLKAVTGLALDRHVLVRIIADDADAARSALQGAGIRFTEDEVVQVLLENRAGEQSQPAGDLPDGHRRQPGGAGRRHRRCEEDEADAGIASADRLAR
jgi:hypothetical protein